MLKSASIYVALSVIVAIAVAGAATYYYITHAVNERSVPLRAAAPPAEPPSVPQDVEREILNGIGSIKDLKPVLPQSPVRR
jgi:hypothetical protein